MSIIALCCQVGPRHLYSNIVATLSQQQNDLVKRFRPLEKSFPELLSLQMIIHGISCYRLPTNELFDLYVDLAPNLERKTHCNHVIPVSVQVLSTLGFLATGTFQREMSDRSGISQSSFSRILPQMIEAILHILSTRYTDVRAAGSLVAINPLFLGRHCNILLPKNFHSLNVQIISDARMQLLNVCSKWPGSTHGDSFILRHSRVGLRLEADESGGRWLLFRPASRKEMHYNLTHGRTRLVVERHLGLLKGRWHCLDASGGKRLYKPEKVICIILACGVLHNIALRHGIDMDVENGPPRAS
uniref:DDE Tnp4 domain-containing protein n=1 Tax=Oncorhynchus kisutch TaxID=8019 RepID=A0A8C7MNB8_ONCKI